MFAAASPSEVAANSRPRSPSELLANLTGFGIFCIFKDVFPKTRTLMVPTQNLMIFNNNESFFAIGDWLIACKT